MCGIAGIAGNKLNIFKDKTAKMAAELHKRGPDDRGFAEFDRALLVHTRLSIIDLTSGAQPMTDATHSATVVFNGEIYNYRELKNELQKKSHRFVTNSDTEVILNSYLEWGPQCLNRLDGMFAFAIWDHRKNLLFLARDRFGKKPLFYAFDREQNLIFASEIKAIVRTGLVKGEIDLEAIDDYLTFLYVPRTKTIYKNIKPLPPASFAIYQNRRISINRYWHLEKQNNGPKNFDEAKIQIRSALEDAVKKRLVADVEVGTFLSGGLDSSIVSFLAQKYSDHKIKTFSAGFADSINELPFAREAAEQFQTDHFELQMNSDAAQTFLEVCSYYDQPFADSSNVPTYLISKFAKTKVKVALSGDGGDELFMGYGWYRKKRSRNFLQKLRRAFHFSSLAHDYFHNIRYFTPKERSHLWRRPLEFQTNYFAPFLSDDGRTDEEKINNFDLDFYLPGDILTKADTSSMMASLEVRSPFLDYRLAELAFNLPVEYKNGHEDGKYILREIFKNELPRSIITRKKHGFGAPVADWLAFPAFKEMTAEMIRPKSRLNEYFHPEEIQKIHSQFYRKKNKTAAYKLWVLLSLEMWLRNNDKLHA